MPENINWGATPDEWFHFDLVLGRTDQLLPVVCNPNAAISPDSKLKALGKTPSRYNRDRLVTGISQWTEHVVTEHDFSRWSKEPDYGICVRTGSGWLALDCDSEDAEVQAQIRDLLVQLLGELPPRRWRANSNKCLYLLGVEGDFRKRIHRLEGELGIIELLASGQQFVACGTHASGARIEWDGGLPDDAPAVSADQLETLWQSLADELPVSVTTEAGSSKMRDRSTFTPGATDETANYLDANGWTLLDGANGERYIRCPFEDGHSTGGDPTSTVYFPAGTAGFDLGHFKCLHASCAHRNDGDFLNAIGVRSDDFDDLTLQEVAGETAEYLPWPNFSRDKHDQIEGTITNVLLALRRPDLCGAQIRLDEFRDETILTTPQGKNLLLRDEYYTMLHSKLEGLGFKKFEEAAVKRAVRLIAYENRFDSLKDWVANLPAWDGVPRIDSFFCRHWGIEANAYTHAVGRYWWTLLAGRALVPGIKGDMAVILVSQQGKNKSEGIRAMAPTPEHYMELDFGKRGEERVREMRGHNVIELGEMRGMDKRGIGDVRVTISTRADRNRGLFREHYVTLPRRCGFIGTSNSDTPLTDTEGNRRWLPMTIPDETDGKFIAQGISDERIQLWAEAVAVFKRDGIAWENAETLAKSILGDYEAKDEVWMSCVAEWLEQSQDQYDMTADSTKKNYERVPLTSKDILIEAIGFKAPQVKRGDEMKIAATMKKLGYKKTRMQSLPGAPYHWVKM
ncbi:TPA: hypothetical protein I9Y23_004361 [Kluyvera ascorbata]|uniref:Uncharacterized protein n=1 Tax=Kluyvera genomosp. 2 TaxID=2774054 RepID=A0A2T2XWK8_9ENTR|nr:VapE domain-containing protein [Kluyvera genomosp. 2]PSR44679.1 hypothetical protein C8256_21675 [Kluyvera genomosp. 2]HAT3920666.1 hypothetical protein [Kluyvera ascorbata]HAT3946181.1 hypothetical protein [Kluyvera ascorbata]HAT3950656.1 hypothetical protein [Kluyvera ascorbata]